MNCATGGSTIRYTSDGSEPDSNSEIYSNPISISVATTLKAKAFKTGWINSQTARADYIFQIASPNFNPPGGTYSTPISVSITCKTTGAVIKYTTNNSEQTVASTTYTNPISIVTNTTLKSRAFKAGWNPSATTTATFVMPFVLIPSGSFTMGLTNGIGSLDETPNHNVNITAFCMSRREVTQGEWQAVMGSNPASGYGMGSDYPVYYVSWYDVLKYCNLRSMAEQLTPVYSILGSTNPTNWGSVPASDNDTWNSAISNWNANGYRLPTEAEWEYAARGATNTPDYLYSGSNEINAVAWYNGNNSPTGSKPVGTKAPNGMGLYDMSGNVFEWCWDWYDGNYYNVSTSYNPTGPSSGLFRVIRGGFWNIGADFCRIANRDYSPPYGNGSYPYGQNGSVGFRVCRAVQ